MKEAIMDILGEEILGEEQKIKKLWQASDGLTFVRKSDALKHERQLEAETILGALMQASDLNISDNVIGFILDKKEKLKTIFDFIENGNRSAV